MKEFYTRKEFCELMGVSSRTVTRWVTNGTLQVVRATATGKFYIPASEVERFKIPGLKLPVSAEVEKKGDADAE